MVAEEKEEEKDFRITRNTLQRVAFSWISHLKARSLSINNYR
jgi:hypothetical protein